MRGRELALRWDYFRLDFVFGVSRGSRVRKRRVNKGHSAERAVKENNDGDGDGEDSSGNENSNSRRLMMMMMIIMVVVMMKTAIVGGL